MAQPANNAPDNRSLHELAIDIVQDIHMLATALAHAGAPPKISQQIEQTANLYAQVAKGLAAGPVGQQPVNGAPAAQAGPTAPAAAGPPPPAAPMAPPPGAMLPGGPGAPREQAPAHGDLHNAIAQAHHDTVNAMSRSGR